MNFQTLLDQVFSTWEREHHVLFERCIKACGDMDAALYWTCAVSCHEYFNQLKPYEVEVV
jgi:hypothetical protein